MATASSAPKVTRVRRPWTKRFSPAELDAVFRDYDAGATGTTICSRYGVSRATLYRWIGEYENEPRQACNVTFLRARIAVLEACVVRLTVKLAAHDTGEAARVERLKEEASYHGGAYNRSDA